MATSDLKSFKIYSNGKILDYRLGEQFNLNNLKSFFQKDYDVEKIWSGPRHILGILIKNKIKYFLKVSTSEGISVVAKRESEWNNYFNEHINKSSLYKVPKVFDSGFYNGKYFYIICEYFAGDLLCPLNGSKEQSDQLINYFPEIINLSEIIQLLPQKETGEDFKKKFIEKTETWFSDIPENIKDKFQINILLQIVKKGTIFLLVKPRHGDLAPWHIIKLENGQLGLIDGEHFLYNGVENYDICYFIQRVFSVLKNPEVAKEIYKQLISKGYDKNKLKVVLAARAIGGFLDESLADKPDYKIASEFSNWVIEKGF